MAIRKLIYKTIERYFLKGCSNFNTLEVRRSLRTKSQSRRLFAENDIPHAQGALFWRPRKALDFAKQHGFPLVIKPNVSGFSRGSFFPLKDINELRRAAFMAKIWWPSTIVERYLAGKNYRVVAALGEIVSVIRRYPPFVKGDGRHSISELIDLENRARQRLKLTPVIHPITVNRYTRSFLADQSLSLESVPAKGRTITLHNKIALAPGGVVEGIAKSAIPKENRRLILQVLKKSRANILGIDIIAECGIKHDFRAQKCLFLELNTRPYLAMHHFPRFGVKEDLRAPLARLSALEIADGHTF